MSAKFIGTALTDTKSHWGLLCRKETASSGTRRQSLKSRLSFAPWRNLKTCTAKINKRQRCDVKHRRAKWLKLNSTGSADQLWIFQGQTDGHLRHKTSKPALILSLTW